MAAHADSYERVPAVAGLFYPRDPRACGQCVQEYLDQTTDPGIGDCTGTCVGAIVPHAGWVCSGAIAGLSIATLAKNTHAGVDVVVVFGAIHSSLHTDLAVLDGYARWRIPTGSTRTAGDIRRRLGDISALFVANDEFHQREHAVEVELPLIRQVWPTAALLAIETPALELASEVGERTAAVVEQAGLKAVYLASSDLTHYGPDYRFTPAGVGPAALQWAKDNDRRLLDQLSDLSPHEIVRHVRRYRNACGGGAIAAMLAACRRGGKIKTRVLQHLSSHDVLSRISPQRPDNAVGYAAVVVTTEGSTVEGHGCGTSNALSR